MIKTCPTVTVRHPNGGPLLINESDFDPLVHTQWEEATVLWGTVADEEPEEVPLLPAETLAETPDYDPGLFSVVKDRAYFYAYYDGERIGKGKRTREGAEAYASRIMAGEEV